MTLGPTSFPTPSVRRPAAGLVLTGGASRRMGTDKARLEFAGRPCAGRVAAALAAVAEPLLEVGPGHTGLPSVTETWPGGPLRALVAGTTVLRSNGWKGNVLVLACDLPLITSDFLALLADWPGDRSVVPMLGGRMQPLLARWAPSDLDRAIGAARDGQRSFRGLLDSAVCLEEAVWGRVATAESLSDVDTPEDLVRLGLRPGTETRTCGGLTAGPVG